MYDCLEYIYIQRISSAFHCGKIIDPPIYNYDSDEAVPIDKYFNPGYQYFLVFGGAVPFYKSMYYELNNYYNCEIKDFIDFNTANFNTANPINIHAYIKMSEVVFNSTYYFMNHFHYTPPHKRTRDVYVHDVFVYKEYNYGDMYIHLQCYR